MKLIKINDVDVSKAISFAYDGCHKIYLCKTKDEENEMKELDYEIIPMEELFDTFEHSCCLRFINWYDFTPVVLQAENYVEFKYIDGSIKVFSYDE